MKRKNNPDRSHIAEKVELTENLIYCFSCNIQPEPHEIRRAKELGIDVDGLKSVKDDDHASTYD